MSNPQLRDGREFRDPRIVDSHSNSRQTVVKATATLPLGVTEAEEIKALLGQMVTWWINPDTRCEGTVTQIEAWPLRATLSLRTRPAP